MESNEKSSFSLNELKEEAITIEFQQETVIIGYNQCGLKSWLKRTFIMERFDLLSSSTVRANMAPSQPSQKYPT